MGLIFLENRLLSVEVLKFVCRNKEHFSNMHLHGFFFRSESVCNFKNKATLGFLIIHYFDVLSFFLS